MGSINKKDVKPINQSFNKKNDDKNQKNKNTTANPFKVTGNKAPEPQKKLNPGALAAKKLAGTKTVPVTTAAKNSNFHAGSKNVNAQPAKAENTHLKAAEKKAPVQSNEISDELLFRLFKEAKAASENAYAPYSKFKVGAVLLIESESNAGQFSIYTGCNVENASFSMTCCAERIAIFKAISDGNYKFKALVLYATADKPVSPCGACRQVISEFADSDMKIYSIGKFDDKNLAKTPYKIFTVSELLPYQFKAADFVK